MLADWDGDDVPDMAVPGNTTYLVVSGATGQELHDGCATSFCYDKPVRMRDAGDMDGDGRHDLMIFAYDLLCDGDVISLQQGGTGTTTNVIQDGSNWVYASPAPLGDLNGDGRDDILVSSFDTGPFTPPPYTHVRSGVDPLDVLLDLPFYEDLAGPGDVDCDGVPDVLGAKRDVHDDTGTFALHSGADGSILWTVTLPGVDVHVAPAGDLNGDGRPDWLIGTNGVRRAYLSAFEAPATYCTGKVSSAGCAQTIDTGGTPTLSGTDDFLVLTRNALAGNPGLLFYGTGGPANVPFLGGTLCVSPPLTRTPPQVASGAQDCQAGYAFHFDQAYAASQGLGVGDAVQAQFWMRDPDQVDGTGVALTNAVTWTWCP